MEWDKIFSINNTILDSNAGRYTAIKAENHATVTLLNVNRGSYKSYPLHPKNPEMGDRPIYLDKELIIDYDDAKLLKVDQKVIFLKIGIVQMKSIEKDGDTFKITAEYLPEDKDFKKKESCNWLAKN